MYQYKIKEGLIGYRHQEHLSQEEMGRKLSMSEQEYARYESDQPPTPDVDTICRMAEVTGKSVDYLLFGKEIVEDRAFKRLPEDFQFLCAAYRKLGIQNTEKLQLLYRFIKFMKAEQNKTEPKTDKNV